MLKNEDPVSRWLEGKNPYATEDYLEYFGHSDSESEISGFMDLDLESMSLDNCSVCQGTEANFADNEQSSVASSMPSLDEVDTPDTLPITEPNHDKSSREPDTSDGFPDFIKWELDISQDTDDSLPFINKHSHICILSPCKPPTDFD